MTDPREQTRLTPDERYELALATDAAARHNRPSHLVVIAGLVFIAACAALGFTTCQSSRAKADLDRRIAQRDAIADLLAELRALGPSDDASTPGLMGPYLNFLSDMEAIAKKVGIAGNLDIPTERRSQDLVGAVRVSYDYKIKGDTLTPLLSFVKEAQGQIPGLRVAGLAVRPRNDKWELDAKFERWERTTQP
ncbi:MAG: hypothetical protein H6810_07975 [Phycisphaeraceae bacterium]|nr:MAG: hypothetical protein H6810_07975 [Phycisphaeraceae bacterium]